MARSSAFGVVFLGFIGTALGSVGDLCYVTNPLSALVNDRLYFMGGNYSVVSYQGQSIGPSASLNWLEVGGQFPVEQNIPFADLHNTTIQANSASIAHSNALKSGGTGALLYTNDTIYVFGGANSPTNEVSAYNTSTKQWKDVAVSGGQFDFGNRVNPLYASDPESGLSFVLGGHNPIFVNGMVRFDASDPSDLKWTNETLGHGSFGIDVPNLESGSMVFLPAGKEGILLAFGGGNVTQGISPYSGWPYPADWSIIYVYDIASHTWWAQDASGPPPGMDLANACTGVSIAPDYSAFYITVYGGWSLTDRRAYEDVFVLSLPSFTWINVTDVSYKTNSEQQVNSTIGRYQASCQVHNGAQMIALGGSIYSGGYSLTDGACSEAFEPVRVLDLSTYKWQTSFDPTVTYKVPPAIYNVLGGNSNGAATSTVPRGGFADPTLSAVLQQRVPRSTSTSSSDNPRKTGSGNGNTNNNEGSNKPPHSSVGAIVGGVVGGIAALALLAGLAFFLLQRRKKAAWAKGASSSGGGQAYEKVQQPAGHELEGEGTRAHELDERSKPPEVGGGEVYELADERNPVEMGAGGRGGNDK